MALQLICSISGVSVDDVNEEFLQGYSATDDNQSQVQRLYNSASIMYPQTFVCFMAVSSEPKMSWIQAFGQKRQRTVRLIGQGTATPDAAHVDLNDIKNTLSPKTGVVIVANSSLINDVVVAAPGDISDVASRSNALLVNIDELASLSEKQNRLYKLEAQAGKSYCEVRIHRHLTMQDIDEIYSLSEFGSYTIP